MLTSMVGFLRGTHSVGSDTLFRDVWHALTPAIIYLFLVSIPLMFGSPPFNRPGLFSYQWSPATLSLAYVGLGKYRLGNHICHGHACGHTDKTGIGATFATLVAANCQDRIYKYMKKRNGGEGQPEYRVSVVFLLPTFSDSRYCSLACDHWLTEQLVLTQIGMIMMPIGLVIFVSRLHLCRTQESPAFDAVKATCNSSIRDAIAMQTDIQGWTAEAQTHWIGPQIATILILFGLQMAFNSLQNL
jgi:DHA1 family multidrug resistance protein-like MFS transporter